MIALADIEAARARIADSVLRTPLVPLHVDGAPAEIYLKLENLQSINSFKIRGATNAVMLATADARAEGLVTASAGNMAQGIAWTARALGVPATIVVPDHAPEAKLAAIERLGGRVLKVPYDEWWNIIITSHVDGVAGLFVHPVQDQAVMAGNGTVGLEILDDLPDPDAVVIPYGGGGLTVGIASAIKALRPGTKIFTAEPRPPRRWPPRWPPGTRSFPEVKDRIAKTIHFVKSFKPVQIDGTEDKEIVVKFSSGERKFKGQTFLLNFCLPNFYFHATTAYDILRHCGIELGKRDFMGTPVTL